MSVLVLRALGIGDLLTAVPALRALRRAHPDERLTLAAPDGLRELVDLVDAVDDLLPTPGLGALTWTGPRPRLAVNLHGSGPESIRDLQRTHAHTMLTHAHPAVPSVHGLGWRADVHEVDRWCRLVEHGDITADRTDLRLPPPPQPSPAPGAVVLHPGAASPARRWPPARFARVARDLARAGHQVVVTGGGADVTLAADIAASAGLPDSAVFAGRLGLAGLAALVADAALVVCGDTGVGHLATAYGTPSVLLFGPTPPRLWGPPRTDGRHVVLWAGDVGDPHGTRPDKGLLLLDETRVLTAARRMLCHD